MCLLICDLYIYTLLESFDESYILWGYIRLKKEKIHSIIVAIYSFMFIPFILVPIRGQVNFWVFLCSWLHHLDFPGHARDVTRISLRIVLQTLDHQIPALNSLTSWLHD